MSSIPITPITNIFLIAGYGPLSFVVEGAHRSNVECSNEGKGHYVMRYKPHEPGIYMLNIKFGDDHVTGKSMT